MQHGLMIMRRMLTSNSVSGYATHVWLD
jgi:hypothetical protein